MRSDRRGSRDGLLLTTLGNARLLRCLALLGRLRVFSAFIYSVRAEYSPAFFAARIDRANVLSSLHLPNGGYHAFLFNGVICCFILRHLILLKFDWCEQNAILRGEAWICPANCMSHRPAAPVKQEVCCRAALRNQKQEGHQIDVVGLRRRGHPARSRFLVLIVLLFSHLAAHFTLKLMESHDLIRRQNSAHLSPNP